MKRRSLVLAALIAIMSSVCFSFSVVAEPYYKGKTITIIVPHNPGGGADTVSRMLARHLPKHIPGKPTIVLRYLLGGMSMVASNWFYTSAPKDGTHIMTGSGPVSLNELVNAKGVGYKVDDMPLIMAAPMGVVVYTHASKASSREAFFKKSEELVFGSNPMPWTNTIHFELVKKLLGFKMKKDILAYDTGGGIRAFLGKEIDVAIQGVGTYNSVIYPLVKKGEVIPLWQSGISGPDGKLVRLPNQLADVPTVGELYEKINGRPPSGEVWEAFQWYVATIRTFNKPIFLPPGAEKYSPILTDAIDKMRKDPEFRKEADKILVGAQIYGGADAKKVRDKLINDGDAVKAWLRNWLQNEHGVKTQ